MTETNYVKLGSICRVVSGSTPKKSNTEYWGGNIPWITPAEIDNDVHYVWDTERHITELGVKKATLNELPVGTVLLSSRAPIGKVAITKTPMFCNQGFKNLICSDQVLNEYLYRYLRANTARLQNCGRGATFKELSKKDVENIILPLPSVSCQRNIVSKFESIDNVILYLNKLLELLDELVKSRFIEMFGDPCDSQRSTMSCCPIEKFCEVRIGPFGSALHKSDYVFGGHALVNPSHIVKGKIKINKKLAVNEEKYASMKAYHLKKGDVVLGRRGEIGRCAVVNQEGLLCGTGSMILRPDVHLCLSEYLQHIVSFPTFAEALERDAVGVTMKNLNAKIVENAVVVLPPMSLQREFISFVHQVDKLKFDFDFLVSFKIPSICLLCLELDP